MRRRTNKYNPLLSLDEETEESTPKSITPTVSKIKSSNLEEVIPLVIEEASHIRNYDPTIGEKGRCPFCNCLDILSTVKLTGDNKSTWITEEFWEENGHHHYHSYIKFMKKFKCSQNHSWREDSSSEQRYECCKEDTGTIVTYIPY